MKCNYRNCDNSVEGLSKTGTDKIYCSKRCRVNEKVYRARRKKNPNPKVGRPTEKWVKWRDLPTIN
jgi:hypothetical protein